MQLREYAKSLQVMVDEGASHDEIRVKIEGFMEKIYRIIAICLGIPPKS